MSHHKIEHRQKILGKWVIVSINNEKKVVIYSTDTGLVLHHEEQGFGNSSSLSQQKDTAMVRVEIC